MDGVAMRIHCIHEEHSHFVDKGKGSEVKKWDLRDGLVVKRDPSTRMMPILDAQSNLRVSNFVFISHDKVLIRFKEDKYWTLMTTEGEPIRIDPDLEAFLNETPHDIEISSTISNDFKTTLLISTKEGFIGRVTLDWDGMAI